MGIEASMVSYYADRANEYERIYQKPERQADLRQLRGFVESAFAHMDVLEVACGTGYWTEILARSAASVLAEDMNEAVLAIARSKPIDASRVTFQKADAYALPAMPPKFTGGFSAFWWSHIPKGRIPDFLRGFHRVLSPGAKVLFIDNAYVEGSSTPLSHTDDAGNTYQRRKLDDGSIHEVLKNFPTTRELNEIIAPLASDVRIEFLQYYWTLTYNIPAPDDPFIHQ